MKHLTTAELADHLEGRVSSQVGRRVEEHLAGCPDCAAALTRLERLIATMRTDRSPEPPAPVLARAIALFEREPARPAPALASWFSGLQPVWGRLVCDSIADPAFAAARGAGAARRLRFEAEGCELDLAVERRQGRFQLLGQVARTAAGEAQPLAEVRIQVFSGRDPVGESRTDGLGEFACQVGALEDVTLAVLVPPQAVIFALPARPAAD
jgi:anti-sigma factor RsiW